MDMTKTTATTAIKDQGPFALLLGTMLLLGSFINQNQTDNSVVVKPDKTWCKNISSATASKMPSGLSEITIAMTLIMPMAPILLNSQAKAWNKFKFEMVKTHAVGQGSVFGMSEAMRHFLILPEATFLQKCNISIEECNEKTMLKMPQPLAGNISFCNSKDSQQLFNSLHHFPDNVCGLIGASIVSFLATLYYWNRANMNGKSIYEADSIKQYVLIAFQVLFLCFVLSYLYHVYISFDGVQLYGLLIGGFIQFMIICSTLPKHDNNM